MFSNRFARLAAAAVLSMATCGAMAQTAQSTAPAKSESPQVRKGVPSSWKQVPVPPLPKFSPQQPKRVELPNGMVIFLQENHELPLIDAVARIRGGSRTEPAAKTGLVDIYGDVWRTGGTEKHTGDAMDDFLEARAAKVETGANEDSTFISFSCLKADFDPVFAMFVELLQQPTFREEKIGLAKYQMNTAIARRNDDTDSIAEREAAKLAYGPKNPYARVPEYATVAAVTREDLLEWHKQHVHPNNMIFGITGDFDSTQMETKLRQAFDAWQKGPQVEAPQLDFTPAKPGIYLVSKTDVNQSDVRLVGLGIERRNPDHFAVQVMNEVFGGGFSSRLFRNLRTKEGLAYSVYGGIGAGWDHPGMATFGMGTKSSTTLEGIEGLRQQMEQLRTSPPTEAELQRAKDSILNSFIFRFDTPGKVLRERMAYEYYGYPADWLERYRAAIDKVTIADVKRVIDKYIHKDQMAVLVVGNPEEFGKPLTTLGAVTNVDITIPGPGGAQGEPAAEKPAASNPEGKALIAKVVDFLGGADRLKSIKALRIQLTSVRSAPQGEFPLDIDTTIQYPDKLASNMNAMGTTVRIVITPDAAFQQRGDQTQDMPPSVRSDVQQTTRRDIYNIAQHADDPSYVFAADGTEKVANTEATVLKISGGGTTVKWLVDPATGQILKTVSEGMGQQGPTERESLLSEWKKIDGVNFYGQRTVNEGGQVMAKDTVKSWTVNPPVDPKVFEKTSQ